jgi:predicted Zn-ribbon and HTH transcriptional regulator
MLPRDHRRAAGEARPELADIFRQYGESYRKTHFLLASQRKVMRAVLVCRTKELGGHLKQCDTCGFEHPSYNSCRNRHCPKCQSLAQAKWLERQTSELLPVGYFHLVFTLPHEFNRLSQVFRGKFLDLLQQACEKGKIPAATNETKAARQKSWVVYAKKPFGSPQTVLDYLGRYTHRVALSNERILSVQNGQVTLSYRDRKDGNRKKTIPVEAHEFIRRFLLHVLPDGFMRVRHLGFLANRAKKQALAQCPKLLGVNPALPEIPKKLAYDLLLELTGIDLSRCPRCQKGTMIVVAELPALPYSSQWDSS